MNRLLVSTSILSYKYYNLTSSKTAKVFKYPNETVNYSGENGDKGVSSVSAGSAGSDDATELTSNTTTSENDENQTNSNCAGKLGSGATADAAECADYTKADDATSASVNIILKNTPYPNMLKFTKLDQSDAPLVVVPRSSCANCEIRKQLGSATTRITQPTLYEVEWTWTKESSNEDGTVVFNGTDRWARTSRWVLRTGRRARTRWLPKGLAQVLAGAQGN